MERERKDGKYIITMTKSAIEKSMLNNAGAFESWAVIEKAKDASLEVELEVDSEGLKVINDYLSAVEDKNLSNTKIKANGHIGRFLYRVMKFKGQYKWFHIGCALKKHVDKFQKKYTESWKNRLFSNILDGKVKAGIKKNPKNEQLENYVEAYFAGTDAGKNYLYDLLEYKNKKLTPYTKQFYRQLPVGLFVDEIKTPQKIFVGGKAAIDLWTYNEKQKDVINIIELKAIKAPKKKPPAGIITELFFYANYMYDVMCAQQHIRLRETTIENQTRGRNVIKMEYDNHNIKKINAIMLSDSYFNEIEQNCAKILEILNVDKEKIMYYKFSYEQKIIEAAENNGKKC